MARGIDLGVQMFIMNAAFRCSDLLPASLLHAGDDALFWVDLAVGLSALVTYSALSERISGATLGKLCTGLRVARDDGGHIDLRAAVIRNAAFLVDSLLFGLVAYSTIARSERGQRLGDVWAKTVVVWRSDAESTGAWYGWPIGMLAAFALVLLSYLLAS